MAKILRFEDLKVWQFSQDLAVEIYTLFENVKIYSFKDQLFRASLSVSNNIAEGFDRSSDGDFIRFLRIAKASASEVKSMIYLATRLNYINQATQNELLEKFLSINKMLNSLIKSIQEHAIIKTKN